MKTAGEILEDIIAQHDTWVENDRKPVMVKMCESTRTQLAVLLFQHNIKIPEVDEVLGLPIYIDIGLPFGVAKVLAEIE